MNFDIVNLLVIVSCLIALVPLYKFGKDIIYFRKQRINNENKKLIDDSEYKKILRATYWLENERQRNTGEHFEDESIFINRAEVIRTSTSFFSFLNE